MGVMWVGLGLALLVHTGVALESEPELSTLVTTPSYQKVMNERLLDYIKKYRADITDSDPTSDEGRLKERLLGPDSGYKKDVRPRDGKNSHNTTIEMGFALRHIREINEKQQTMTINGWLRLSWLDHRLKYSTTNTSLPTGTSIRFYPHDIWLPDITLYNNFEAADVHPFGWTPVLVMDRGLILWVPPVVFTAHCKIDLHLYPYDTQMCDLVLGSWTHDGYALNLDYLDGATEVDLTMVEDNVMWRVVSATAERVQKFYPCCAEPYLTMEYHFVLQRNHAYFTHSMLLPAVVTMLLSLLTFWLPPDSHEKISFGTLNLILTSLFFIYTSSQVPVSDYHVPLILRFYSFSLVMITISLLLATLVVKIYHRAPYRKKVVRAVPNWIRVLVLNGVGRVMCLHRERYQSLDDRNKGDSDLSAMTEDAHTEDSNPESDGSTTFRQFVLDKQISQTAEENMIADWQLVAIVIDRVFFLLYSLAFTIAILVIVGYE